MAGLTPRWIRLGDAVSQFFNVLIFDGDPNYSISGDAFRLRRHRLRRVIDALFSPWESDHCRLAYENDRWKAALLVAGA